MSADELEMQRQADAVAAAPATSEDAGALPETAPAPSRTPRKRRVLRRVLISLGILGMILALVIGGGIWLLTERYAGNIHRVSNVFAGINQRSRPAPAAPATPASDPPVTFLLVGSDTRQHFAAGQLPNSRSDTIILARISGDRRHVQLVSIPRDSWVPIPGHGTSKINAAYAWGGPALLIQTIENLTHVRIDHFAAIDFDGMIAVTDKLGGVDVQVASTTHNGPYTFSAGTNHLDGQKALWYLRQRYRLPGGDFDRERRQQQFLKAMFTKLFSADTFTDPSKLDGALRAVTSSVAVDDTLSNTDLLSLAISLRHLTPDNVQAFTAPVLGTGMEGAASVVYLDKNNDDRMWAFLRNDTLALHANEFAKQQLPAVPN